MLLVNILIFEQSKGKGLQTLDLRGGVLSIVMPIWLNISANCFVLMPQLLATLVSHRR
jgi:hypothetical protein